MVNYQKPIFNFQLCCLLDYFGGNLGDLLFLLRNKSKRPCQFILKHRDKGDALIQRRTVGVRFLVSNLNYTQLKDPQYNATRL